MRFREGGRTWRIGEFKLEKLSQCWLTDDERSVKKMESEEDVRNLQTLCAIFRGNPLSCRISARAALRNLSHTDQHLAGLSRSEHK